MINLALRSLVAAFASGKNLVDEAAARSAVSEVVDIGAACSARSASGAPRERRAPRPSPTRATPTPSNHPTRPVGPF